MELQRFMFEELDTLNLMEIHSTATFYKSGVIVSEYIFSFHIPNMNSDNLVYVCSK